MAEEPNQNDQPTPGPAPNSQPAALSKSAQKKLARQQRQAARKAEKKAQEKERKRKDLERRRREWDDKLRSAASEEERAKMIEESKETRRERMGMRAEERGVRAERLRRAEKIGQKLLIDLEFVELMTANEIHSLVQQDVEEKWKHNYKEFLDLTNGSLKRRTNLILKPCKIRKRILSI